MQSVHQPFRRVLWERQPYADNYVDDTLLDGTVVVDAPLSYTYGNLCQRNGALVQKLCTIALVLAVWERYRQAADIGHWCGFISMGVLACFAAGASPWKTRKHLSQPSHCAGVHAKGDAWRVAVLLLAMHAARGAGAQPDDPEIQAAASVGAIAIHLLAYHLHRLGNALTFAAAAGICLVLLPSIGLQLRSCAPKTHTWIAMPSLVLITTGLMDGLRVRCFFVIAMFALAYGTPAAFMALQAHKEQVFGAWEVGGVTEPASQAATSSREEGA